MNKKRIAKAKKIYFEKFVAYGLTYSHFKTMKQLQQIFKNSIYSYEV